MPIGTQTKLPTPIPVWPFFPHAELHGTGTVCCVESMRTVRKKQHLPSSSYQAPAAASATASGDQELMLRKIQWQNADPWELRCVWQEWLPWAQILASSHTQKSTKFLNLGYLVFLNNTLIFKLLAPRCKHLYKLSPLRGLLGIVLSGLLEMLSPELEVLKISTKHRT